MERPHILVVDDTPANLHSMKKLLEPLQVVVVTASSGNEALTTMLQYEFVLILLDVNMPIMDGYETAELIMQMEEYQHVPIIFITAMSEGEKNSCRGYAAGAVDYLYKPINPQILISKVKVFIKIYLQRKLISEQKEELNTLLENKENLLLQVDAQNKNKDFLLTKIKKQTKKLKVTFALCITASLLIVISISWMYGIILNQNKQLVSYTELLNEKNILFSDLKKALQESGNPKVLNLLDKLEESDVKALTSRWSNPAEWEWRRAQPLTAEENEVRYKIVTTVAELANIISGYDRFFIPTAPLKQAQESPGWLFFGTRDKKSDVDYVIATIKNDEHLFKYNAIQGRKAVIASVLFRALFGSTSLQLLDTEFYPPAIGTFLREPLSTRVSLAAIFSQMANLLTEEDLKSFSRKLKSKCAKYRLSSLPTLMEMLDDAVNLHKNIEAIKKIVPNPELANNIISNKITLAMADCGDEIDKRDSSDVERELYINAFAFLYVLRTQFLPEGYISKGAYQVVCENRGGQEHQLAHRRIEEENMINGAECDEKKEQAATEQACKETALRNVNSPQELLESIGENSAYFHHRQEIIDASKYGTRVYEEAIELIKHIKERTIHLPISDELTGFEADIESKALEMSLLESAKRGRLFERAFMQVVEKRVCKEESFTAEETTRALIAARSFYRKASYGSDDFVVMTAEHRLKDLIERWPRSSLGLSMQAMAESTARLPNGSYSSYVEKLISEESKATLKEMKARRNIDNQSDEELFNLLKAEMKETVTQLLVYALMLELIPPPEMTDIKYFMNIKTDVEKTIKCILENTFNLGFM